MLNPINQVTHDTSSDALIEYTVRDQQMMRRATRYFLWQASRATEYLGQRVLEVGCGVGNFTSHLLDRELVVGLDVVADCVAEHDERFAAQEHVEARLLDILDPAVLSLRSFRFDSIVCLNVLEHISDDEKALHHMHALLPPGGKAVFIVPAFASLYGPIDHNLGHYRRYSKASWKRLARVTGFREVVTDYMNIPGFFGWWMNAKVLKKTEQSGQQIAFFDSCVVPVCSRVERLFSPPFGQSLFAVLERT
jgi:SAM-dependent methyltransferase